MPNRIKLPVLIIKIVYKKLFIIKDFSTSDADIGVTKESSKRGCKIKCKLLKQLP